MAWKFSEYPDNWRELRAKVLENDNYECQRCGAVGRKKGGRAILQCAHKTSMSNGGAKDDPNNLEAVCLRCHVKEHPHMLNNPLTRRLYEQEVRDLGEV